VSLPMHKPGQPHRPLCAPVPEVVMCCISRPSFARRGPTGVLHDNGSGHPSTTAPPLFRYLPGAWCSQLPGPRSRTPGQGSSGHKPARASA
jgi:hypothetical protein